MGIDDFDDAGKNTREGGTGEADGGGVLVNADLFEAFEIGQAADGNGGVLQGTVGLLASEGQEVGAEESQRGLGKEALAGIGRLERRLAGKNARPTMANERELG